MFWQAHGHQAATFSSRCCDSTALMLPELLNDMLDSLIMPCLPSHGAYSIEHVCVVLATDLMFLALVPPW